MEHNSPTNKVQVKRTITEDELFETLTLISLLSKNLAKKVLLIPKEEPMKVGGKAYGYRDPRQNPLSK